MKKQKAKIGDEIIIVNALPDNNYLQNGEILNVVGFWDDRCHGEDFYGVLVNKMTDLGYLDVFEEEYKIYLRGFREKELIFEGEFCDI